MLAGFGCSVQSSHKPLTPQQRDVLLVMLPGTPEIPNSIGSLVRRAERERGAARVRSLSHEGKQMGEGSMIAPALTSLVRRGLLRRTARPDGRSGGAYVLTAEGEAVRTQLRYQWIAE